MTKMTSVCKILAEHVQSLTSDPRNSHLLDEDYRRRLLFLSRELENILLDEGNQIQFESDYLEEEQHEEVQNPWLLELTQRLFK